MPSSNVIQFSTSSFANSIKKGNAVLGINSVEYGPTSTTGFWNGITPPSGGYTIYVSRSAPGPNIYTPSSNNELITYSSKIANIPFTSTSGALAWFATQSNSIVVNKSYPNIVTDGLSLLLDASFTPSYPTTNSVWYDLSGNNYNGSLTNFSYFNSNIGLLNTTSLTDITESTGNNNEFSLSITTKLKQAFDTLEVITQPISSSYSQSVQSNIKFNNFIFTFEKVGNFLNQKTYLNSNLILNTSNTNSSYNLDFPLNIKILTNSIIGTSSISEIKTYNKILSQVEVNQNYYQAPIITDGLVFAIDASNLVSYESSSTTTYSLTESLSGSLVNGTGYLPFYGGAWDLDGADDYINIPYSGSTSGSFTFNIIMKSDTMDSNNSNRQTLFGLSQNGNAAYQQFDIEIWGNTGRGFRGNGGPTENVNFFGYNWTLGVDAKDANIYTIILNSTSQTIYVNGQLRNTINQIYTASFNSITLGTRLVGNLWNGQCYYFSIYNRELLPSEVAQNFNAQRQRFGV